MCQRSGMQRQACKEAGCFSINYWDLELSSVEERRVMPCDILLLRQYFGIDRQENYSEVQRLNSLFIDMKRNPRDEELPN